MQEIMVDYSGILRELSTLSEICSRLINELKDMYEMTQNLDIFWNGDTNAAFITKINEDMAFMNLVSIEIKECIKLLNKIMGEYQDTEKVIDKIIEETVLKRI